MRHARPRIGPPRARNGKRAGHLGWLAALLAGLSRRKARSIDAKDLRTHDHSTSTQRLGVRFTERIRDTFRFRWLRHTR
jgi:hypothetical protein